MRAGSSGIPTDRMYTGQRFEAGIGLYDYNARFYDPQLGRFISADTIVPDPEESQSFNRYSYVNNNPLRYTDPSGHFLLTALALGLVGGALGGFAYGYGSQVVNNLDHGMDLGQALTTNIDPVEVAGYTALGAAIGGVGGLVVGAVGEAAIAAGLVNTAEAGATLVTADLMDGKADSVHVIQNAANAACGGDCSDESVDLFRAVSPEEFYDVIKTGQFSPHPDGYSLTVKEFGLNLNETINYANHYSDYGAVLKVRIPYDVFLQLDHTAVDSFIFKSGTVHVTEKMLKLFNKSIELIEQAF